MSWFGNLLGTNQLREDMQAITKRYDDLNLRHDDLNLDYEAYRINTENSLADSKNKMNVLQHENEKLKDDITSGINERNMWDVYQGSIDFSMGSSNGTPTGNQTTPFNGTSTSYNDFNLMQMQLFDQWSRAADVATNYKILFCERIEKSMGLDLSKVIQGYQAARNYVKSLFDSPDIYNLLYGSFRPTTNIYSGYPGNPGFRAKPIPNV